MPPAPTAHAGPAHSSTPTLASTKLASTKLAVTASSGSCDVSAPLLPMVSFPSYADSAAEQCGIWSLEDDAYQMYAEMHGYPAGDPRITETGAATIAGYVDAMGSVIADASGAGQTLTADEQGAYDYFAALDQTVKVAEAADALREYNNWLSQGCAYRPPNTSIFSYNPTAQPICQPAGSGYGSLFTGLTPPTYQDFISYGIYDAESTYNPSNALTGGPNAQYVQDQIFAGTTNGLAILAGVAPQILSKLGVLTFQSLLTDTAIANLTLILQPRVATCSIEGTGHRFGIEQRSSSADGVSDCPR